MNFNRIIGYHDEKYPALDSTTSFYEFLSYQECCMSLGVPVRLQSFMKYQDYIKSIGID